MTPVITHRLQHVSKCEYRTRRTAEINMDLPKIRQQKECGTNKQKYIADIYSKLLNEALIEMEV